MRRHHRGGVAAHRGAVDDQAVVVGRTVILNEETPKLAQALREAGYAVRPLCLTEFIKAGGSAKCLTLRLDGEEAAAWKYHPAAVAASA